MRSQQKSAIMRTPLKLKMTHWLQNFMGMRQPLQVLKTVSAHQVHHLGQGQTQQNDTSFITSGPLSSSFSHKNTYQTYYSEPKNCSLSLFLYMSLSLFPVSLSLFIWHTHTHTFSHKPLSLKKTWLEKTDWDTTKSRNSQTADRQQFLHS